MFRSANQDRSGMEIGVQDVEQAIAAKTHTVVDVRENDEWLAGHIAGAVHIPLGELLQRVSEIPTYKPIFTVCHAGVRSLYAVQFLEHAGYEGAKSLAGGMEAWEAAGRSIEK